MSARRAALIAKFKGIAAERLERLNNGLIELERQPDQPELVAVVMREIHTLKGEAKLVGFADINVVSHKIEDVLIHARGQGFRVPAELFDLALRGFDLVTQLLRKEPGGDSSHVDLAGYLERVDRSLAASGFQPAVPAAPAAPSTAGAAAGAPPAAPAAPATPPAAAPATPQATPTPPARRPEHSGPDVDAIRVDVRRVDTLTDLVGDLLRHQAQTERSFAQLGRIAEQWRQEVHGLQNYLSWHATDDDGARQSGQRLAGVRAGLTRLEALHASFARVSATARDDAVEGGDRLSQVERTVRDLRLLPLSALFGRYPRAIRDMAREQGKKIHVALEGGDVEADKRVLDQIDEPLLHLIRNAIDHGIETPAERLDRRKPETGRLVLAARQEGASGQITVSDDGRGLSPALIRQAAVARGVLGETQARDMPDEEILNLIFLPAFSTRSGATDLSGRGIGMDVVKERVERLGGSVRVRSVEGQGTTVFLDVPLSVALMQALVVEVGDGRFALPSHSVTAVTEVEASAIVPAGQGMAFRHDGELVPLHDLGLVLGHRGVVAVDGQATRVVVVENHGRRLGLRVQRVVGRRELVQRPLDPFLAALRLLIGAAILEHDLPTLILNVPELIRQAGEGTQFVAPAEQAPGREFLVLVAEDSELTRDMLVSTLRSAKYNVVEASNGRDALERIHQQKPDLVLTDIEMPLVTGLELIAQIRATAAIKDLPIVVLSSLGSQDDKLRAAELGADAYLVKSEFRDETLLETVQRLLHSDGE